MSDYSWLVAIVNILTPVLTAALIALVGFCVQYIKAKAASIKDQNVRNAVYAAMDQANAVAKDAIMATKQILVDDLKAKAADGKLTKEEAEEAMRKAKDYFLSHISSHSLSILEATLGPIEVWLGGYMEARLTEMKIYSPLQ